MRLVNKAQAAFPVGLWCGRPPKAGVSRLCRQGPSRLPWLDDRIVGGSSGQGSVTFAHPFPALWIGRSWVSRLFQGAENDP